MAALGSRGFAATAIDALRFPDEMEWLQRGYAVVYVARRGAFGSTGASVGSDDGYTMDDYSSQRVSAIEFGVSSIRYQSSSMVAAMGKINNDARIGSGCTALW